MAGYSGTPLARKLGIKPGARLLARNAPEGYPGWLEPLPEGVAWCGEGEGELDVIHLFATEATVVARELPALARRLRPAGGLWVSWPKKSAKMATDLDENRIRAIGLAAGLVDNKVCAVNEVWSGLRFVYRLRDRPAR